MSYTDTGLYVLVLSLSFSISLHITKLPQRSRNWVAKQDGDWNLSSGPNPESEPQSANRGGTLAQCGVIGGSRNYDYPKTLGGDPLPPNPQLCYEAGDNIDLEVQLTAHHKGHFGKFFMMYNVLD